MAQIGIIQATLIPIVPTLPTFLILRQRLPGALVILITPLPAVALAGGLIFAYVGVAGAAVPDGGVGLVAILLGAAWALAALMTAIMMAVAALLAGSGKSGKPSP